MLIIRHRISVLYARIDEYVSRSSAASKQRTNRLSCWTSLQNRLCKSWNLQWKCRHSESTGPDYYSLLFENKSSSSLTFNTKSILLRDPNLSIQEWALAISHHTHADATWYIYSMPMMVCATKNIRKLEFNILWISVLRKVDLRINFLFL